MCLFILIQAKSRSATIVEIPLEHHAHVYPAIIARSQSLHRLLSGARPDRGPCFYETRICSEHQENGCRYSKLCRCMNGQMSFAVSETSLVRLKFRDTWLSTARAVFKHNDGHGGWCPTWTVAPHRPDLGSVRCRARAGCCGRAEPESPRQARATTRVSAKMITAGATNIVSVGTARASDPSSSHSSK
jgi:hypothetical protein